MTRLEARRARHARALAWVDVHAARVAARQIGVPETRGIDTSRVVGSGVGSTPKLIRKAYPTGECVIFVKDVSAEKSAEMVIAAGVAATSTVHELLAKRNLTRLT